MSKIKLVIERSRFAAGQYDKNLANEADTELTAMQARIEKLETENSIMYAAIWEASELGNSAALRCKVELQRIARNEAK